MAPKQTRRRASDQEENLKQILSASAAVAKDPEMEAEMKTTGLGRMVDMRIPLWGILSSLGLLGLLLINMWLSVQQLTTAMADVQLTLKAGNNQATTNLLEIERIKGRLERAEETYRDLQAQLMREQFHQGRKTGQ